MSHHLILVHHLASLSSLIRHLLESIQNAFRLVVASFCRYGLVLVLSQILASAFGKATMDQIGNSCSILVDRYECSLAFIFQVDPDL